jgi:type I restriction enzyme S subunit
MVTSWSLPVNEFSSKIALSISVGGQCPPGPPETTSQCWSSLQLPCPFTQYKSNGGELVYNEELEQEIPAGWESKKLNNIIKFSKSKVKVNNLNIHNYISTENMLANKQGIKTSNNLPTSTSLTKFEMNQILISNIRPYFKKIWLSSFSGGCSNDVLCFVPQKGINPYYIYSIMEQDIFFAYVMQGTKGTKMPRGDKSWIMKYHFAYPKSKLIDDFGRKNNILMNWKSVIKEEVELLNNLSNLLLSKIAKVNIT